MLLGLCMLEMDFEKIKKTGKYFLAILSLSYVLMIFEYTFMHSANEITNNYLHSYKCDYYNDNGRNCNNSNSGVCDSCLSEI